ncbi:deoxynucleoside kinase [Anaerococcus urinomassiliensis]|uniref:deoxynucleoside kinase n=1 Tax=Anaerococcus urinomassiliensis TaxID=1745712 RepID=UPI001C4432D1|nr:deoxynucleoside kinase [Anaerococcus urinomassiliensis]
MPVIVLAGMIASGKSTVSARLAKELGSKLMIEPVDQNPILPLYYKDKEKYAFLLQIYFLNERFKLIKEALTNNKNVLDRSIYEDELFTRINLMEGNISQVEYDTYADLLANMLEEIKDMPKKFPDLLVYLDISFDKFLDNLAKRGRDFEQIDLSTEKGQKDLAYFKTLHKEYQSWYENYSYSDKIAIDMNKYDVNCEQDWQEVFAMIMEAFDKSLCKEDK